MINIDKDIKGFIGQLNLIIDDSGKEQKKHIIIKYVLLKWLLDHKYIGWSLDLHASLNENFTFGNILNAWGNKFISFQDDNHNNVFYETWSEVSDLILGEDMFSQKPSTILGEIYEFLYNMETKKRKGMYYTPLPVIEFMIRDKIKELGPRGKTIDPACGCGFFLGAAYDFLMECHLSSNSKHKNPLEIHRWIVENQLFGLDKDPLAVCIAKLVLLLKQDKLIDADLKIFCQDALLEDNENIEENSFDLIIGNPPYIGHKKLVGSYRLSLKEKYTQVFHDKGDLSYCFFLKGLNLLKPGGILIFIVSRYFLEALYGSNLRNYIKNRTKILSIIDFYGQRILKGIGVDPLIISITKETPMTSQENKIDVYRLKNTTMKISAQEIFNSIEKKNVDPYINNYKILQNQLNKDGWRLLHPIAGSIIKKIEHSSIHRLEDLCESKQGIITGRDEAFIFHDEKVRELNFNRKFIKPWIKGKNIQPYTILESDLKLLYADEIEDIEHEDYKAIYQNLYQYKEILEKRRECIKGLRKWYELQWGRDKTFFESKKIIFPYKSNRNRFALDEEGFFYSADVYGLRIKEDVNKRLTYYSLIVLLNSMTYDFYFKGFGKKLGYDLYEYYPNTIMRLAIPNLEQKEQKYLDDLYIRFQECNKKGNQMKMENIKVEADRWIMDYFQLTEEEKAFIEINNTLN